MHVRWQFEIYLLCETGGIYNVYILDQDTIQGSVRVELRIYTISVAEALIFVNNSTGKVRYRGFSGQTSLGSTVIDQRLPPHGKRQGSPLSYIQPSTGRDFHPEDTVANVWQVPVLILLGRIVKNVRVVLGSVKVKSARSFLQAVIFESCKKRKSLLDFVKNRKL